MSEVLDTNVLLRFLVGDNAAQKTQAEKWFGEAEKSQKEIIVPALIIAEAIFVLENFYKKSRTEIAAAMELFLSQRWLNVPERDILLTSLSHYQKGNHFADSYLLAWQDIRHTSILTFDKGLKKQATAQARRLR